MTQKIIIRRPSTVHRRQPLLVHQSPTSSSRFAEVAGGTTAECAAICCCCPCGLVNLLVLAVYKLPAGLCRKALKKKRLKRLKQREMMQKRHRCGCGCDETDMQIHSIAMDVMDKPESLSSQEVQELENEMWARFYSTGFWRSPSQREDDIDQ